MDRPQQLEASDKPISNFTTRNVIETLREVEPREFQRFLKDAGLGHLLQANLADAAPPAVRTSELARLYATLHRQLGETLTRVFLSNYGHKMSPMLLKHADVQVLTQRVAALPAAERLSAAVRGSATFLSAVWANIAVREDAEAYHLEVAQCPICADIRGARGPVCASSEVLYTALIRAVTAQRLSLVEVACRAQGAATCSYRLRK